MPTYYIDYNRGNDANNGLSPETAFKSPPNNDFSAGNSASVSLQPGDVVLLRRGQRFRFNAYLRAVGISGVTYGAYGAGNPPVWDIWDGLSELSVQWNEVDHGTWSTDSISETVFRLKLNGTIVAPAENSNVTAKRPWFWDGTANRLYVYSLNQPNVELGIAREYAGRSSDFRFYGVCALYVSNASNITINGIQFDGGFNNSGGLISSNNGQLSNITIADCSFFGYSPAACRIVSEQSNQITDVLMRGIYCDRLLLKDENPASAELGGDGISFIGDVVNSTAQDCQVVDAGHNAFTATGSTAQNASPQNCRFINCKSLRRNANYLRVLGINENTPPVTNGAVFERMDGAQQLVRSQIGGVNNHIHIAVISSLGSELYDYQRSDGIRVRGTPNSDASGIEINNVTIANTLGGGVSFQAEDGGTILDNVVQNSIVYDTDMEGNGTYSVTYLQAGTGSISGIQTIENCVFYNPGRAVQFSYLGNIYSLAEAVANIPGFGSSNIEANPLFINPNVGDHRLRPNSPCVGAGVKWWGGRPRPTSLSGEPYPDTDIDIGAYQSTYSPNHPLKLRAKLMAQFNDQKHCGLLQLTGLTSGHITDLEPLMLENETGLRGHVSDLWHAYWDQQGVPKGASDRAQYWLNSIGYVKGDVQENWYDYWTDMCLGGGMPDIPLTFPLTADLNGTVDGEAVSAAFSRTGVATVEDFEGQIISVLDGEARFWGARRVQNLYIAYGNSGGVTTIDNGDGTFTTSGFGGTNADRVQPRTATRELLVGHSYVCGIDVIAPSPAEIGQSVRIQTWANSNTASAAVSVILTDSWQRIELDLYDIATENLAGQIQMWLFGNTTNGAAQVTWRNPQIERATGTQAAPSEYVDPNIEHGANVNGVKYFTTDRNGASLGTLKGCMVEEGASSENLSTGDEQETLTLDVGQYTAWLRTTDGSGAAIVETGAVTNPPGPHFLDSNEPLTFEVTTAGDVIFNGDVGAIDHDDLGNPLKQLVAKSHHSSYMPPGQTRNDEALSLPSPLVLRSASTNDVRFNFEAFRFGDGAFPEVRYLMEVRDLFNANFIQISRPTDGTFEAQKRSNSLDTAINLTADYVQRRNVLRYHLSSTEGMYFELNDNSFRNPNTEDVLDLDQGDGRIHIGSSSAGFNIYPAGYSQFIISSGFPSSGYVMLVGTNGGFLRGYRDINDAVPFGDLNRNELEGLIIYQISGNTGGAATDVLSLGPAGDQQIPGVTQVILDFDAYGTVTLDWSATNLRYEAPDTGLAAFLDANVGNLILLDIRTPGEFGGLDIDHDGNPDTTIAGNPGDPGHVTEDVDSINVDLDGDGDADLIFPK